MPVTTAAVTSRRARRARRNRPEKYYFPSSAPRSHSELVNPAGFQWTEENSGGKAQGIPPLLDVGAKKLRVVTFEGDINMEEGEAHTLAMTRSNPGDGSRTISPSSSNESSPTITRAPVPGGNSDDSPQGIEKSFKRRRSFSKSRHCLDKGCLMQLSRVKCSQQF